MVNWFTGLLSCCIDRKKFNLTFNFSFSKKELFMKRVITAALILALVAISLFAQDSDEFDEIIVYITNTGTKYHREACNSLRRSKIPVTLEQAIERGYEPCRNCKP